MNETRRDFLKKSGCALGMVGLATQMHHFGALSAMAQTVIDAQPKGEAVADYKALVCIFLAGGNDGNNLIIPFHTNSGTGISDYTNYQTIRVSQGTGGLAFAQTDLQGTQFNVPNIAGLPYAFNPYLGGTFVPTGGTKINNGIAELFGSTFGSKLAAVLNVGTLARPMTKTQYQNGSVIKPYQLFSHSDQVAQYQTGISNTQAFTGWGGRLADRMNDDYNVPLNGLVPMVTSISGAQLFTAGQTTLPMAVSLAENDNNPATNNLTTILDPAGFSSSATSNARLLAFNSLRSTDLQSNYIAAASHVTDLAIQAGGALHSSQDVSVTFPLTNLGRQLKQVARLIRSKDNLNISRQVFYVQSNGYDTHTNQVLAGGAQNSQLFEVGQALRAFWDEMGAQGMQNNVTAFTLSDFSRTMLPAGIGGSVGSDHAWGNHMLVLGGAVNGGNFYGSHRNTGPQQPLTGDLYPTLALGGPDDTDGGTTPRGRWLPTTSVDQYAVRLARWFGVVPGDESTVFPNLQYFDDARSVLGFMQGVP
jgi:uncharacterized protein (DUF1501 family)